MTHQAHGAYPMLCASAHVMNAVKKLEPPSVSPNSVAITGTLAVGMPPKVIRQWRQAVATRTPWREAVPGTVTAVETKEVVSGGTLPS